MLPIGERDVMSEALFRRENSVLFLRHFSLPRSSYTSASVVVASGRYTWLNFVSLMNRSLLFDVSEPPHCLPTPFQVAWWIRPFETEAAR